MQMGEVHIPGEGRPFPSGLGGGSARIGRQGNPKNAGMGAQDPFRDGDIDRNHDVVPFPRDLPDGDGILGRGALMAAPAPVGHPILLRPEFPQIRARMAANAFLPDPALRSGILTDEPEVRLKIHEERGRPHALDGGKNGLARRRAGGAGVKVRIDGLLHEGPAELPSGFPEGFGRGEGVEGSRQTGNFQAVQHGTGKQGQKRREDSGNPGKALKRIHGHERLWKKQSFKESVEGW